MTVLTFPIDPVDGQVYPPTAIPGVNQYKWNSSTGTWEIVKAGGVYVEKTSFTTNSLAPGQNQDFPLDLGKFFSLISIGVTSSQKASWIRLYTSASGRTSDTRTVPGPPFPSPGSGFAAEVVTSSLEPVAKFLPATLLYAEEGLFVRLTNQSLTSQPYTLEVAYLTLVESV